MIRRDDPDHSSQQGGPPDLPIPEWVALRIIRWIVPKPYRDEFISDLLEEYEIILRVKGGAAAREWFRGQVLHLMPQCLLWRLERGIVILRSGELLSWVLAIALFAYLLPAFLIGATLYGVAIVICFLMDAARLVKPPDPRGPGWVALWMIMWVVPKTERDEFVGDLVEEYEIILKERGGQRQ